MTTIVMVEKDDHVEVAYDSKVSAGWSHAELEQEKVFESSGILYGVAGDVSVANIVEGLDIKPPKSSDPSYVDKWVTFGLLGSLRKIIGKVQPLGKFQFPGQMIVVVHNRVYEIGPDYSRVRYTSGNYAIGSGSHFAKGALDGGSSAYDAVTIAANNDPYTGHKIKTFKYNSK